MAHCFEVQSVVQGTGGGQSMQGACAYGEAIFLDVGGGKAAETGSFY
ncbi:MAG TPA: hypothetical protein H9733_10640 [Candidatus Anaerotignum merdipullorum]|nr:hypothetical protein [Candidatus Anaerotignum merdipullorum]